jgi:hypothetical protein
MFFVLRFDLLLLRYFITSGIRGGGFKIDPLLVRLSAALPGSMRSVFFIGSTTAAVLRHHAVSSRSKL